MSSLLVTQLDTDLRVVEKAIELSESLRDFFLKVAASEAAPEHGDTEPIGSLIDDVRRIGQIAPEKLDWQIYEHCAALTRIYAVYERFVFELVVEYVRQLPDLFEAYSDLPAVVAKQHRLGIAFILARMSDQGRYKHLKEHAIVIDLAAGLSGQQRFRLLPDAFLADRPNLRFQVVSQLFQSLGFRDSSQYINQHGEVVNFLKNERPDGRVAQKELDDFIEFRNEAAHKKVENVLAIDEIRKIARFVKALGRALNDMVSDSTAVRRMELGQFLELMTVQECFQKNFVVVGKLADQLKVSVGDVVFIFYRGRYRRARIESIQLDGRDTGSVTGDGVLEVGLRLDSRASVSANLRVPRPPAEPPALQLNLDDDIFSTTDDLQRDLDEPVDADEAIQSSGLPESIEGSD
jgi:hypothetical protein